MRLIDADAVMKVLDILDIFDGGKPHFLNGIVTAKEIIANAPTIEAEPVKRGRWIDYGSFVTCSVCNEEQYGIDTGRFYCPNCGAKMEVQE